MEYYYKREFLRDWFERNKKSVTKKEMMQVMGTTSANNLQVWMLEKKPPELKPGQTDTGDRDWLPLRCILRLCSRYDLKISDFIGGAEDIKVSRRRKVAADSPDVEMQLRLAATKQELAETRLDYEQRMNALHARYEEREDMIRKGYDDTIRRLLSRIPAAERQEWPHTAVSDDGGVYGQTEGKKACSVDCGQSDALLSGQLYRRGQLSDCRLSSRSAIDWFMRYCWAVISVSPFASQG